MIDKKFFGTKWDASDWSESERIEWQEHFDPDYVDANGAHSDGKFTYAFIYNEDDVTYCGSKEHFKSKEMTEMVKEDFTMKKTETGMKFDTDKPMYNLIPANAIDELAKVLTFGAEKYAPNSWQDVPDGLERYRAAMLRHAFAIQRGEIYDQETGLPHSAHIMCNAAFITELQIIGQ